MAEGNIPRMKVVDDGVEKSVLRRCIEFDAHRGERGRFLDLPVIEERATANPDVEALDADVLKTEEGFSEVAVAK